MAYGSDVSRGAYVETVYRKADMLSTVTISIPISTAGGPGATIQISGASGGGTRMFG